MTVSVAEPSTMKNAAALPTASERVSVVVVIGGRMDALEPMYRANVAALRDAGYPCEFVFVASRDQRGTVEPLLPLAEAGEPVHVLEAAQNIGETGLLRAAAAYCTGSIVITLPPAWRVDPAALPLLVARVQAGAQLVVARRDGRRDAAFNRVRRRLVHGIIRRLVGGDFHDLGSGVAAMRPEVLHDVPLYGETVRFLPLLAQREGFLVEELTVHQHDADRHVRVHSPGIYLRRAMDLMAVFFMVRFREKPLRFFGLIGSLLAMAGSVLLAIMFVQRMGGQALAERPLLVVAVLLLVVGLQAIGLGLVGEIIVHSGIRRRTGYRLIRRADP
jgi:hypothetical protein